MKYELKLMLTLFVSLFLSSCLNKTVVVDKDSNSIIFYESGSILKTINLDDKGFIFNIQTFKNNKIESEWIADNSNIKPSFEYYGNGQIKVKGYLKENKKHSLWSYYDRDGHLLIDRYFNYGKPTSIWIWYDHHNNNKVEKYEYSIIPFTHCGMKVIHHSLMDWFFPMVTRFGGGVEACHFFNIQEIPFLKNVIKYIAK